MRGIHASVRLVLVGHALAIAGAAAVSVLLVGLPLAARREVPPAAVALLAAVAGASALAVAALLLYRGIGRPVTRILSTAQSLASSRGSGELPLLGEPGDEAVPLSRAALAFDRLAGTLAVERQRLAEKVAQLEESNRVLASTRESLLNAEKLATVGRLASGLAHEIGNPLGAVRGYADLARQRVPADAHPDLADSIARIGSAADRIDRILRELLEFARPAPPVTTPIDLRAVVDAALSLARVQPRFKRVEVVVDVAPGVPPVVADEHHLAQVFLNLFLNAGDATDGTGHVAVEARRERHEVIVIVEDDGPGIAPEHLPHVFDPFFTTKDPGSGTGLGLAISHRIVESLGGGISASNRRSGGARFELRLRAAEDEAPPARQGRVE